MIPQEKIEHASNIANDYKHFEESEAFKDGFYIGVRFAEADLGRKAPEFLEWVEANCSAVAGNLWEFIKDPFSELFTSSELYAKFEEERGQE